MNQQANNGACVRRRLRLCAIALGLVLALVLCNLLVALLPWRTRSFRIGGQTAFQISAPTKIALSGLQEDVQLYLITEDGELSFDRDLYTLLKGYDEMSDRITLRVVSNKAEPEFLTSRGYSLSEESGIAFLVESSRRSRLIDLEDAYTYYCVVSSDGEELSMTFTPEEFSIYGSSFVGSSGTVEAHFDAEYLITNAISFVLEESVPTVAVLKNDVVLSVDEAILQRLERSNYEIEWIGSVEELDAKKHELLLYNTPKSDLEVREADALRAYLAAGGDLFLTSYYGAGVFQNLGGVLEEYGLSADERRVRLVENNQNYVLDYGTEKYMFAKISSLHEATADFDGSYVTSDVHAIKIEEKQGVITTSWLYTTESGSRERVDSSTGKATAIEEERTAYTYGAIAERGESRVIWVSTPYALARSYDILNMGSNLNLMATAIEWSLEDANAVEVIDIEPQTIRGSYLQVTWTQLIVWTIVLAGVLPVTALTVGIVRRYLRRRA